MRCYSNTTTERLEAFGRNHGIDVGVMISPDNSAGRYFVTERDGEPLTHWVSLGWTVADAKGKLAAWLPIEQAEHAEYARLDAERHREDRIAAGYPV